MSTYYQITPTKKIKSSSNYIDLFLDFSIHSVWDVYASQLARSLKIVHPKHLHKPRFVFDELKYFFLTKSSSQVTICLFEHIPSKHLKVFKDDKDLVKEIIYRIKSDDAFNLLNVYEKSANWSTKLYLWQFITLLHYFKAESPTIELIETTIDVKSKVLPEGSIPNKKSSSRWTHLVSRFLRDAEEDKLKNLWLEKFGDETMASPNWFGYPNPIYDAMVLNRKRKSCEIKFICEEEWVRHLNVEKVFDSAG